MFNNGSEFKQDFTTFIKDLDIKPVLKKIKNPQAKYPVERVHQVILDMPVTKYLNNKDFDHIDPWGETLSYIALVIRESYHLTIMNTPGQAVFYRYMLFNLTSGVYWIVVTSAKQSQVDSDNARENARQAMHDYAIGDQFYMKMNGIYRKLDYKK